MAYLGFHEGGGQIFAGHYSAYTKEGNHVFKFFPIVKTFFCQRGSWPNPPPPINTPLLTTLPNIEEGSMEDIEEGDRSVHSAPGARMYYIP